MQKLRLEDCWSSYRINDQKKKKKRTQTWVVRRERKQQWWSSRRHSLLERTLIWNLSYLLAFFISTPGTVLDTDLFWTWAPLDNKLFLRLCLRIKMCRCFISISCPVSCARTGPVLTCASEAAAHLKKSGPALPLPPQDRQRAPHSMETMFSNPQRERNFFFFQERKLSLREIK